MNKLNRKVLLAVIGLLAIASVAFIIFKVRSSPAPTPSEKFQQNLNVTNYFQGTTLPIENDIKSLDFKFPSELPYLRQTNSTGLDINVVKGMANSLGFTTEPTIVKDVQNGNVYIWSGDSQSFSATPKTNTVQLSSNLPARILIQNAADKKLKDSDYESLSQGFLTGKIGLNKSDIKFVGFTYFKIQNGVEYLAKATKSDAEIIQLNYSEGVSKYPIYTVNPDQAQISIQLLKDGSVMTFAANLGLNFQESPNQSPLKNYDQFSSEVKNSVLVSLNDNNVNLPDIKSSDIQSIKIKSASLVYLIDLSSQGVVQPVFLLEGDASVTGFGTPISAALYLPAFESFSQP